MKRIMFIQMLFLVAGSSLAQTDTCPYTPIIIHKAIENKDPSLNFGIVTVTQQKNSDYRDIYFIHGLGGKPEAWSKVSDAISSSNGSFTPRKCVTHLLGYTDYTKKNISVAADHIGQNIRDKAEFGWNYYGRNPNRGIIIAHSQGGIVSRRLLHDDFSNPESLPTIGKGYGGLVTVASPLQGARILNNRQKIHDLANDACRSLIRPAANMLVLLGIPFVPPITNEICDVVTGPVLKLFALEYYHQITDAYVINGSNSEIALYNSDASNSNYCNMPKVAFYAVEPQENIFWRTAQWLVNDPNKGGFFDANDDYGFYKKIIAPTYTVYLQTYMITDIIYSVSSKTFYGTVWCCPFTATTAYNVMMTSAAIRRVASKGVDWFIGANNQWQAVIGARTYNSSTKKWEIKSENDGIVLAESAMNLPCATREPVRIHESGQGWAGSSHMQVRNDEGIKKHLDKLFKGDYGDFFRTDPK